MKKAKSKVQDSDKIDLKSINKTKKKIAIAVPKLKNPLKKQVGQKRDHEGKFTVGSGGLRQFKKLNLKRAFPLIVAVALVGGMLVWRGFAASNSAGTVRMIYLGSLCVEPDPGGLEFWAKQIDTGKRSVAQVIAEIQKDPRYKTAPKPCPTAVAAPGSSGGGTGGSGGSGGIGSQAASPNLQYVQSLYVKYIGNTSDSSGINWWANQIDSNKLSQAEVEQKIAASSQAKARAAQQGPGSADSSPFLAVAKGSLDNIQVNYDSVKNTVSDGRAKRDLVRDIARKAAPTAGDITTITNQRNAIASDKVRADAVSGKSQEYLGNLQKAQTELNKRSPTAKQKADMTLYYNQALFLSEATKGIAGDLSNLLGDVDSAKAIAVRNQQKPGSADTSRIPAGGGSSNPSGGSCTANITKDTVNDYYQQFIGKAGTPANVEDWVKKIKACLATTNDLINYLKNSDAGQKFASSGTPKPSGPGVCYEGVFVPAGSKYYATDRWTGKIIQIADYRGYAEGVDVDKSRYDEYYVAPDGSKGSLARDFNVIREWARRDGGFLAGEKQVEAWVWQYKTCQKSIEDIRKEIQATPEGKKFEGAFERGRAALIAELTRLGINFDPECVGYGKPFQQSPMVLPGYNKCAWHPSDTQAVKIGLGEISVKDINLCTGWSKVKTGVASYDQVFDNLGSGSSSACQAVRQDYEDLTILESVGSKSPPLVQEQLNDADAKEIKRALGMSEDVPSARTLFTEQSGVPADSGAPAEFQKDPTPAEKIDQKLFECGSVLGDPSTSCFIDKKSAAFYAPDVPAGADQVKQKTKLAFTASSASNDDCLIGGTKFPILNVGDSGKCVQVLRWLVSATTRTEQGDSTSEVFDQELATAISELQSASRLPNKDGSVDAQTWQLLNNTALNEPTFIAQVAQDIRQRIDVSEQLQRLLVERKDLETCKDQPILKIENKGGCIKRVQQLLNGINGTKLATDGMFNSVLERAVKNYQESHGLLATGIVDAQTWLYLEIAHAVATYHSPYRPASGTMLNAR